MALRLGKEIEGALAVDGEVVKAYFPGYNDPAMREAIQTLLSQKTGAYFGQDAQDVITEARVSFFDATCLRVAGLEDADETGEWKELTAENFPDWKDRVPVNLKTSWAAAFEEKMRLTKEQVGNFEKQSEHKGK